MDIDIRRATEEYICAQLRPAVPTHNFVPYNGIDNAGNLEAPFTVVYVGDATATYQTESTWIVQGTVQIVTDASETLSEDHATLVKSIYATLKNMQPFVDGINFTLHGIDVSDIKSATDQESHAHADVISFTAGVGG